tara:strand:- start:444 stop:581 length:138 start_codon:yes stop_codon:yes gene_type:complete
MQTYGMVNKKLSNAGFFFLVPNFSILLYAVLGIGRERQIRALHCG